MKERLVRRWEPRRTINAAMTEYNEITTTLGVTLNSDGEVVDVQLVNGSFFQPFDDEALRAFKQAAPFPNPPDSLRQEDGKIYMTWRFTMFMGGWGQAFVE